MNKIKLLKQTSNIHLSLQDNIELKIRELVGLEELVKIGKRLSENNVHIDSMHMPFRVNQLPINDLHIYINTILSSFPFNPKPSLLIHPFTVDRKTDYETLLTLNQKDFYHPFWLCHETFYGQNRVFQGFENFPYEKEFSGDSIHKVCYDVSHRAYPLDQLCNILFQNQKYIKHISMSNFNSETNTEHLSVFDKKGDIEPYYFLEFIREHFDEVTITLEYNNDAQKFIDKDLKKIRKIFQGERLCSVLYFYHEKKDNLIKKATLFFDETEDGLLVHEKLHVRNNDSLQDEIEYMKRRADKHETAEDYVDSFNVVLNRRLSWLSDLHLLKDRPKNHEQKDYMHFKARYDKKTELLIEQGLLGKESQCDS